MERNQKNIINNFYRDKFLLATRDFTITKKHITNGILDEDVLFEVLLLKDNYSLISLALSHNDVSETFIERLISKIESESGKEEVDGIMETLCYNLNNITENNLIILANFINTLDTIPIKAFKNKSIISRISVRKRCSFLLNYLSSPRNIKKDTNEIIKELYSILSYSHSDDFILELILMIMGMNKILQKNTENIIIMDDNYLTNLEVIPYKLLMDREMLYDIEFKSSRMFDINNQRNYFFRNKNNFTFNDCEWLLENRFKTDKSKTDKLISYVSNLIQDEGDFILFFNKYCKEIDIVTTLSRLEMLDRYNCLKTVKSINIHIDEKDTDKISFNQIEILKKIIDNKTTIYMQDFLFVRKEYDFSINSLLKLDTLTYIIDNVRSLDGFEKMYICPSIVDITISSYEEYEKIKNKDNLVKYENYLPYIKVSDLVVLDVGLDDYCLFLFNLTIEQIIIISPLMSNVIQSHIRIRLKNMLIFKNLENLTISKENVDYLISHKENLIFNELIIILLDKGIINIEDINDEDLLFLVYRKIKLEDEVAKKIENKYNIPSDYRCLKS